MALSKGIVIRLCLIVLWFAPLVKCAFGDKDHHHFAPGHGRGGGGFRSGGFDGSDKRPNFHPSQTQQAGDSANTGDTSQAQSTTTASPPAQTSSSIVSIAPDASASVAPASVDNEDSALSSSSAISAPASASTATSSVVVVVADSSSGIAVVSSAPSSALGVAFPAVASSIATTGTSASLGTGLPYAAMSTATATVWQTVMVAPTPQSITEPSASTSTLDLAPLSTSAGSTMSASARAGMGIGITFGILTVATLLGFYLWRRRQNKLSYTSDAAGDGGFAGFFMPSRKRSDIMTDPEWSFHSAEKVEIVSVRAASHSDSGGESGNEGSGGGADSVPLGVLKVGMQVPDRPRNVALSSNPITPRSSARVSMKPQERTASWPLPD